VTLGVLGALGVLLASLGLYAVMAWQVASRRREIGLRKAVGATDTHLLWSVVSGGSAMGAVGALLGLAAWYPLLPVSTKLVHGIDSAGGLVPLWVALVVGTACLLATLVPAARATKVDPVVTLEAD
jgi:ABC-type antimicrobial peptide transport system permease subunit